MEEKTIKISTILELSEQGKTKEEIRVHFGLTKSEINKMFQHPKLKGLKPKKGVSFTLVDDTEESTNIQEELDAIGAFGSIGEVPSPFDEEKMKEEQSQDLEASVPTTFPQQIN